LRNISGKSESTHSTFPFFFLSLNAKPFILFPFSLFLSSSFSLLYGRNIHHYESNRMHPQSHFLVSLHSSSKKFLSLLLVYVGSLLTLFPIFLFHTQNLSLSFLADQYLYLIFSPTLILIYPFSISFSFPYPVISNLHKLSLSYSPTSSSSSHSSNFTHYLSGSYTLHCLLYFIWTWKLQI